MTGTMYWNIDDTMAVRTVRSTAPNMWLLYHITFFQLHNTTSSAGTNYITTQFISISLLVKLVFKNKNIQIHFSLYNLFTRIASENMFYLRGFIDFSISVLDFFLHLIFFLVTTLFSTGD